MDKNKVVLGISGGVDSTAAALMLRERGFEVTGLYFDVHEAGSAEGDAAKTKARDIADSIGIRFIYKNVARDFKRTVIDNFCEEYMRGRTPNPCIICNPTIKFRALTEAADEEGAYHIATGHYAGTRYDACTGSWHICRAANERKDQSYMLYRLPQEVIARLILPLDGVDDKTKVRETVREHSIDNADAKDSQEICFLGANDDYKTFLHEMGYESAEGDFVDESGNVLGSHSGIAHYTIGQRKGLGIALGKPAFVTGIDAERNRVVLGKNKDLFSRYVKSEDNILHGDVHDGDSVTAKIRYAAEPASAVLHFHTDDTITTEFDEPRRAVTPGQSIVFYKDDIVIGGGFIATT